MLKLPVSFSSSIFSLAFHTKSRKLLCRTRKRGRDPGKRRWREYRYPKLGSKQKYTETDEHQRNCCQCKCLHLRYERRIYLPPYLNEREQKGWRESSILLMQYIWRRHVVHQQNPLECTSTNWKLASSATVLYNLAILNSYFSPLSVSWIQN